MSDIDEIVTHPPHYLVGGIEVREILRAKLGAEQYEGYLAGTILAYLFRYPWKDSPLIDLYKAEQYLTWLIEEIKSRQKEEA